MKRHCDVSFSDDTALNPSRNSAGNGGLKKSRVYQFISACESYELLSTVAENLPTNEKQIRPLTRLKNDDDVIEAWNRAVVFCSN